MSLHCTGLVLCAEIVLYKYLYAVLHSCKNKYWSGEGGGDGSGSWLFTSTDTLTCCCRESDGFMKLLHKTMRGAALCNSQGAGKLTRFLLAVQAQPEYTSTKGDAILRSLFSAPKLILCTN